MRKFALLLVAAFVFVGCTTTNNTDDSTDGDPQTTSYTAEEVGMHSTEDDCWMAIDGSVYDATDYIADHPAGSESILRGCGVVYTLEEFNAVNPHQNAADLLEPLFVGELES